ncbi:MAG TPA: CoA transferase [Candidatus Binataceae bacterium]|nr:CoA transferase [Candidatus Binataceae bacterium]
MLSHCKVLDLTTERGMLCGQIFGDLGADVIKVEPIGGSPVRRLAPFFGDQPGPERSVYWWAYNRNKRGMTLDLERDEGRNILRELAKKADFILESENPGALARLGLGYRDLSALNPALVMVSITPFGQEGPKASYADSDLIIMAAGGVLILYGDEDRPPIRMSVPQAYLHASVDAVAAALIAYYERLDSGLGQQIDVSAQESIGLANQSTALAAPIGGEDTGRMAGGAKLGPIRVPLVWKARDGQVSCVFLFGTALGPFTRKLIDYLHDQNACDQQMRETDWISYGEGLLTGRIPMEDYERKKAVIAEFLSQRTKAELFEAARAHNLLIAPVSTMDDVLQNPQFAAREYWRQLTHPETGVAMSYPGPFARFGATPIQFRRRPPVVGEHNREVLAGQLGLSESEFAELQKKGII